MPHAPDLTGAALDGRYELHALIGEGTFGRVYRGRDRRLARPVAIKVIKPWWAEDPEWRRSFEREAQLLASVSDPGIVQIFDVGSAPEGLYYVTELVDGESLVSRLRGGWLDPDEAADIGEQIARALSCAHYQRVVHRDVKPANVLLSSDGRVKVTDFGVARLAEGSTDGLGGTVVGTPRYMAPEQANGAAPSPATDVYGVGVVLYEMLAGHPPFEGVTAVELLNRHLHEAPPPLPAHVPAELSGIVARALAKEQSERYADGAEMARALARARAEIDERELIRARRGAAAGGGVAVLDRPPAPPSPPRPSPHRRPRRMLRRPGSRPPRRRRPAPGGAPRRDGVPPGIASRAGIASRRPAIASRRPASPRRTRLAATSIRRAAADGSRCLASSCCSASGWSRRRSCSRLGTSACRTCTG